MRKSQRCDYYDYSRLAVKAEKAKEYEYAASLWSDAAMLASNVQNIEWAMYRKLFCIKRSLQGR
ncbi:ANR family transcriptional regulator [Yersinia enterocolitica]|uniref:ANR family transcriptional regulator n=1 Tax=Yersinia enterocolitica TaxID=630 RepID=UPI0030D0A97D